MAVQALSSLLVNAVLKRLFGRVRPDMANLRTERTLRRAPGTLSFPSGHSSSAAAFATGVALEAPAAGAVLAAIPVMVLFLFLQKYLVSGLTAGSVKG